MHRPTSKVKVKYSFKKSCSKVICVVLPFGSGRLRPPPARCLTARLLRRSWRSARRSWRSRRRYRCDTGRWREGKMFFCAKFSVETIKTFALTWLWHASRPAFQDCKREEKSLTLSVCAVALREIRVCAFGFCCLLVLITIPVLSVSALLKGGRTVRMCLLTAFSFLISPSFSVQDRYCYLWRATCNALPHIEKIFSLFSFLFFLSII